MPFRKKKIPSEILFPLRPLHHRSPRGPFLERPFFLMKEQHNDNNLRGGSGTVQEEFEGGGELKLERENVNKQGGEGVPPEK